MGVCFVIENIIIDYSFQGESDVDKQKVENNGNSCLDAKAGKLSCPKADSEKIQNRGKSFKVGVRWRESGGGGGTGSR